MQNILLATDFSEGADCALERALFWAGRFEAALHVLHVVTAPERLPKAVGRLLSQYKEEAFGDLESRAASKLEDLLDGRRPEGVETQTHVRRGETPAPAILEFAEKQSADLIALGTHGRRGVRQFVTGSTSAEVVRQAECPVLLARNCAHSMSGEGGSRILAPVDFSEHSRQAVRYGRALAATCEATLRLVHVARQPFPVAGAPGLEPDIAGADIAQVEAEELREGARRRLQELREDLDVPAEPVVLEGHAPTRVVQLAEENDAGLIVMASHGRTGLERLLLGSTAERVMRRASCPVLVVKSFGRSLLPDRDLPDSESGRE